ncbi:MAG: DUF1015 family protein [Hydrogeniiclostridium mannosilyticum]
MPPRTRTGKRAHRAAACHAADRRPGEDGHRAAGCREQAAEPMEKLYDFDLQQGGGHLAGWLLSGAQADAVAGALSALCSEEAMEKKYGLRGAAPLLFAVGDGNHSLATAKQCYENLKRVTPRERWASLPARYALVEVVNNHDEALRFEPIHRVVFGVDPSSCWQACWTSTQALTRAGDQGMPLPIPAPGGRWVTVPELKLQLAVGTLQASWMHMLSGMAARWTISTATAWRTSWGPDRATSACCPPWGRISF